MPINSDLLADFAAAINQDLDGELRLQPVARALYANDASMYEQLPVAVLIPRSARDVARAVAAAHRYGIPVLARGGGSALAGQTVNEAVAIDFSPHLNQVLEFNQDEGWVRCEPGITLDALNRHVADDGWMVGPDPASGNRATLGGMYANNATGTHSIRYGNMIRHIRSARVVLSDGESVLLCARDRSARIDRASRPGIEGRVYAGMETIIRSKSETIRAQMPPHWRRNNGYRLEALLEEPVNLARLLCGSEGTLGIVTELTLNLVKRPERTAVGVVHFESRVAALRAVTAILDADPSAVELVDGVAIEQARASRGFSDRLDFVHGHPGALLLTEFDRSWVESMDRLQRLTDRLPGATSLVRLESPQSIADAWSVRKESLGLLMSVKGDHKPIAFIEDASVPVEHLAEYIEELTALLDSTSTRHVMYAHASAGCLHVRPFINTKDAADVAKMRQLARGSMLLAKRFGGWMSSEHGDGIARGWLNREFLGEELFGLSRQVKQLFDPTGVFNPGRILDTPDMADLLRSGPDYETLSVLTDLDFSHEGGLDRAIEQCNGNGACRQVATGGMCPSFMATREESESTRGRANVLRMAMAGRIPGEDWTGDAVHEVMELCVQCKACKTECPSSVDMAKIKTEWLNQRWKTKRPPIRTRLFAHWPDVARRLSGPLAPVVNRLMGSRVMKFVSDRFLGISRERELPKVARHPFHTGLPVAAEAGANRVALFVDTFHNYQQPRVPADAMRVLEAAGFDVVPIADVCCGRTYLSKGFVTRAQVEALATVERLFPYAQAGIPIVGLEPSCILTLIDEFEALLPGDPRTTRVGGMALTFEQFVAQHADRFSGLFREGGKAILHGHCHQKALTGTAPSVACLEVAGMQVDDLDTACCGMAGSFGYEKEHLEVSRAMGERRLAPAVRAADATVEIVAAGTSCRSQIESLSGRVADHPASVLRRRLIRSSGPS